VTKPEQTDSSFPWQHLPREQNGTYHLAKATPSGDGGAFKSRVRLNNGGGHRYSTFDWAKEAERFQGSSHDRSRR